jgi:hypothetical protein
MAILLPTLHRGNKEHQEEQRRTRETKSGARSGWEQSSPVQYALRVRESKRPLYA